MRVSASKLVLLSALLAGGDSAHAGGSHSQPEADQWGTTHFPVSCRPEVQDRFNRAAAILHSFEYGEAIEAFQDVLSADPDCAMAHWGVAASYARVVWGPPWIDFERGREAIRRALDLQAGTPRELAYIKALAALFEESEGLDYETRVHRFAQRMGAARSGHPAEARREVEKLSTLHGKLTGADEYYYAGTVAIWQQVLAAWIAHAEGAGDRALELMQAAADLDDRTAYVGSFESGPDALVHTREQLGDLLLALGRPGDALSEYKTSLETAPNRFNCLYGAGRAAELAGDPETALAYYRSLVQLTRGADSDREPLRHARDVLQSQ